jgi:hypothetical protein
MPKETRNKAVFYSTSKMLSYRNQELLGVGTSFFARYLEKMFLITTAHQLDNVTHVKILLLRESLTQKQKEVIMIPKESFIINKRLDFAWVNASKYLIELMKHQKKLELRSFVLAVPEISEMDVLDSIFFVGYPTGLIDTEQLTPLMRRCSFSSIYEHDFGGEEVFIIDGSVFPGSSGSPVFHVGEKIRLLGVISSSYLSEKADGNHFINLGRAIKIAPILRSIQSYQDKGRLS